ncbi:uncharacterized protein IUM83_18260 [Phytophthora cinnamomi]|uniref:uncharacterized protein n=1 Tax=Phytophthora cinnamomi TaxID=4785 RepID=UPI00355A959C|nr:hypothetical protein IUM83_18260 [Phytophthora cinnamomi]
MLRLVAAAARCRVRSACLAAPLSPVLRAPAASLQCKSASFPLCFSNDADPRPAPTYIARHSREAWHRTVAPALRTFLRLKNHLMVPIAFVVPRDDDAWPRASWGYPLGKHAEWLRTRWRKNRPLPRFALKDLEEMDFAFDTSQYKWDRFLKPALRHYFELFGDTDVPQSFSVPKGDAEWPERLWGLYLGPRVLNIRHRGDFKTQIEQDAQEMEEIRFCYDSTTMQ